MSALATPIENHQTGRTAATGFSLVEVLLILAFLSAMIMPYMTMIARLRISAKNNYISASQELLYMSRTAEMSPLVSTYQTLYNDSSQYSSVKESGTTIFSLRKTDGSNSNSLQRTTYVYMTSPKQTLIRPTLSFQYTNVYRLSLNNAKNLMDSGGNYWTTDSGTTLYNSSNNVPGPLASYTASTSASTINNATGGSDGAIYQSESVGTSTNPVNYAFNVPNGYYTVKLFRSENDATVNAGSARRLTDITLSGTVSGSSITGGTIVNAAPYSAYESAGGTNLGNVLMYDVAVTNGVLAISIGDSARVSHTKSGNRLAAIEIRKRTL